MAIRPKNTTDIKADKVNSRTTGSGVIIDDVIKFLHDGAARSATPQFPDFDLGNSVAPEHIRSVYAQNFLTGGNLPSNAGTITNAPYNIKTNNIIREIFLANGSKARRYGHTGFTSGGDPEQSTAGAMTNSVTPVVLYSYTPVATGVVQVMLRANIFTRDATAESQCLLQICASGSCNAGVATAGVVTIMMTIPATPLVTATIVASGGTLQLKIQNVSGTNVRHSIADIITMPLSTST
jgi:hypothetical protein